MKTGNSLRRKIQILQFLEMKVVLLLFAILALTNAVNVPFKEFLFRKAPPSSWLVDDRADPHSRTTFHIALKQRNLETLQKWLELDSDPESPIFAQHKTQDEILSLIEPSPEVQQKVLEWISAQASRHPKGDVHIENLRGLCDSTKSLIFQ